MDNDIRIGHYTYRVQWSNEDGEYVGTCAEFPGLSWLDESPALAINGIRQVVWEAVAYMEKNGEDISDPLPDRRFSG